MFQVFNYADATMLDAGLKPYDLRIEGATDAEIEAKLAHEIARVHGFPIGTVELNQVFADEWDAVINTAEGEELFLGTAAFSHVSTPRNDLTLAELFGVEG